MGLNMPFRCRFRLHSLRSRGTSAAAANVGVLERLFNRHSLWFSENVKDSYIKDKTENRLDLSRSFLSIDFHFKFMPNCSLCMVGLGIDLDFKEVCCK